MISIIIPIYNTEKYLTHTVRSAVEQTYRELEVILVDDGSTDKSGALCNGFAKADGRVRVVHKKNGGLSSARNAGLDICRGEWVMFVDGDDFISEHALEALSNLTDKYPDADFIQYKYAELKPGEPLIENTDSAAEVCIYTKKMFERLYRLGGVGASACTKLYSTRVFERLRFKEGIRHEDEQLMTRLLPDCKTAVYTDMVLYGYVMRGGSIINSGFSPSNMDVFGVLNERCDVLAKMGYAVLKAETERRIFVTAVNYYCMARRGGYKKEAAKLKTIAIHIAKKDIEGLSGQYKAVYKAVRITPSALDAYYLTRRIFKKT